MRPTLDDGGDSAHVVCHEMQSGRRANERAGGEGPGPESMSARARKEITEGVGSPPLANRGVFFFVSQVLSRTGKGHCVVQGERDLGGWREGKRSPVSPTSTLTL